MPLPSPPPSWQRFAAPLRLAPRKACSELSSVKVCATEGRREGKGGGWDGGGMDTRRKKKLLIQIRKSESSHERAKFRGEKDCVNG